LGVEPAEARQHHQRARSNSESGIKGITYNDGPGTYSVDFWRDGQAKRVGTFFTLTEAQEALQKRLLLDNPDLHSAPTRVDRNRIDGPDQRGNPDAANLPG
jgi:hypothetical protein